MVGSTLTAQDYYATLADRHLAALWQRTAETNAPEPRPPVVPWRWRRADYWPLVLQAADLMTPDRGAERRVVQFLNPANHGGLGATHTLTAAVQLLLPGEIAPPHRHTPAAIRFVLDGDGAYTTVDGEQCVMHRHDLILTPNWTWHDHGNSTDTPMVWLDGLDVPLVRMLQSAFFEPHPAEQQAITRPDGASLREYVGRRPRPGWPLRRYPPAPLALDTDVGVALPRQHSPLCIYPWAEARQALDALADTAATPYDDVLLEYPHPLTGGPVMPTLACYVQMLRPGVATRSHRHTSSAVYYVVEGEGSTRMGDETFAWGPGDVLALPPWTWHAHANASQAAPAILFSLSDAPVYVALDLYREQAAGA